MSDTGHTPGPWSFCNPTIPPEGDWYIEDGQGRTFASVFRDEDKHQTLYPDEIKAAAANARMIAAAPELLEALDRCAFLLGRISDGDCDALDNAATVESAARAAIAKATGGDA